MFRGISPLSLDSKGRLSIPARFRDRLSESGSDQVVVTIDRDGCLLLYPLPAWEQVEARLVQLSSTNRAARSLKRLLMGHAEELELDASGRLLLPAPLREFAKLYAAGIPGLEQRPDILVARADHALYAAKAAGRNRVERAGA